MGMPGLTVPQLTEYAAAPATPAPACAKSSKMTVAELRNVVNPTTKYYDSLPAKAFIEDETVSGYDKVCAVFGKAVADSSGTFTDKIEAMRKAVS